MSNIQLIAILTSGIIGGCIGLLLYLFIDHAAFLIRSMRIDHSNKKFKIKQENLHQQRLVIQANSVEIQRYIRKNHIYELWSDMTGSDKLDKIEKIANKLFIDKFNSEMIIKNIDYRLENK